MTCIYFLNDGNFRNGRDFRNVGTDIKCPTFLEPQPQADLNDDENFRNGRNVIIDMCHTILETQARADLNGYKNFRNGGMLGMSGMFETSGILRMSRMAGLTDKHQMAHLFGTISSS